MAAETARTALVTGASSIGAGIARALSAAGHRVAVGFRERAADTEAVAKSLAADDARCVAVALDPSDDASVRAAVARVERELGPVELLVHHAELAQERPLLELSDADWERMLGVHLLGPVRCARAVLPGMLARGFGRIVNVGSLAGQRGDGSQAHRAAAHAALLNFTRSLSHLYCGRGLTANAIAPGLVEGDAGELASAAAKELLKAIPLGRAGTIDEIGATAVFLCSDEAAYVTGETFNLNGGAYRERS
jgi:NAD(P)-dependent dehydrogenase (short-subunit alcohol dehydrogenase family)